MSVVDSIWSMVTHDIGMDLGTTSTLVSIKGLGIVFNEPSVVALNKVTKQVLAVGSEARRMIGRTPSSIVAVRPLRDGVISDFDTTEAMIRYFIRKVHDEYPKLFKLPKPRVVIGVPSSITEVESRAVTDAALSAGARKVYIIEEPMAAAIGVRLPIEDASGSMIIDIGGGKIDFDVLIATPTVMAKVGALGRVLGPKGLLPNPKNETVTMDLSRVVKSYKAGKLDFKMDDGLGIHVKVATTKMTPEEIKENLTAFFKAVLQEAKSISPTPFRSVVVSPSMGPGVKLEVNGIYSL